ncbi:hypothetical protein [Acinetobacter sp. ASP199]|uniref:hypothetical protein n=1 Tax=unclassified Acinetobacter TaxID=196816 RepID=UPI001F60DAC1|nr:hypothetical protein [Acinetobacter sp. ASP199]UNT58622.1 hypothetical protein IHE35_10960 [Acinetobacter sp. ASP199]
MRQLGEKPDYMGQKKSIIGKTAVLVALVLQTLLTISNASVTNAAIQKAKWYRYYDHKGVANISSNVTPNHIRYGYEALDQNMQVIQRAKPYNVETDIRQAPQRAAHARQQAEDQKLKRAYNNSQVALQKKNEVLSQLKKQMAFQQEQLKQLQKDRIMFVRQEREFLRKGKNVPEHLKNTLLTNEKNLTAQKENIQSLQSRYRNKEAEYDRIIQRLKALE